VQRLIANLLTYWMLLLVPGATALDLARPQVLLPACCRVHGAHHCMATTHEGSGPAWRGEACPFANLTHAAILLAPDRALLLPSPDPYFALIVCVACVMQAARLSARTYSEISDRREPCCKEEKGEWRLYWR
jgi:hypothetical protein